MGISDILRGKFGLPEQKRNSETEKLTRDELNRREREYFEKISKIEDKKTYNFIELKNEFQKVYKQQNGQEYIGEDSLVLDSILQYFSKDIAFIIGGRKRSFDKGLLLKGGYGVGKTSIMRAIKTIFPEMFGFKSAIEIVNMYDNEGSGVVKRFGEKKDFCFDDLGAENGGKHYGKNTNVLKEILELRYYGFKRGIKTHATTNMNQQQFLEMYGERNESRLYEMFNIIVFKGNDKRKEIFC